MLNGACERPDGRRLPYSSWIIDGHERLIALRDFAAGEWAVFGDVRYSGLSHREKADRFWGVLVPHVHVGYQDTQGELEAIRQRLAGAPPGNRGEAPAYTGRAA